MKNLSSTPKMFTILLSWLFVGYLFSVPSVKGGEEGHGGTGTTQEGISTSDTKTSAKRVIFGTVEGLTDTHIKVEAGEVGEMAPRYLEIEKRTGKGNDIKMGDRLKIVVGSQNLVQDYSKIEDE